MWDGGTVIARDGDGCRIRWGRHAAVGEGMQGREEKTTGEEGNARAPWHRGEGGCGHHAEGRERGRGHHGVGEEGQSRRGYGIYAGTREDRGGGGERAEPCTVGIVDVYTIVL
jgi:hypothetical protein